MKDDDGVMAMEEELETLDELLSKEDKPEEQEPKAKPPKAPREREREGAIEGGPDLSEASDERAWYVVHCYSG